MNSFFHQKYNLAGTKKKRNTSSLSMKKEKEEDPQDEVLVALLALLGRRFPQAKLTGGHKMSAGVHKYETKRRKIPQSN